MSALATTRLATPLPAQPALDLLQPLIEQAERSSSLLCTRHPLETRLGKVRLPKFLYLGPRAGGTPIRVAVLAGLENGRVASTAAVIRLLERLRQQPPLARDYALFLYPLLDLGGGVDSLPQRLAAGDTSPDAAFLRHEFCKWTFDGVIALSIRSTGGFEAEVDSPVLAENVLAPALARIPRAGDRLSVCRPALPWLAAELAQQPPGQPGSTPFQVNLTAGGDASGEDLATAVEEFLRHYRRLLGHAPNL